MDVFRRLSFIILLYEQNQFSLVVRSGNGSVRANDGLALCILERLRVGRLDNQARSNRNQGSLVVGKLKDEPKQNVVLFFIEKVYKCSL